MHFSLIQPRPGHEREAAFERNREGAYEDHQWLWQRFFPAPPGTPRDYMFRRLDAGVAGRFYVVSARTPRTDVPGWEVKTKRYEPAVSAGQQFQFELRANPVVSRRGDALLNADGSTKLRPTGKPKYKVVRHDVVMDAKKRLLAERGLASWGDWQDNDKPVLHDLTHRACAKWLHDIGREHGFEINRDQDKPDQDRLSVDAYTQHRGKGEKLRFSSVDFAGELTVFDAVKFGIALTLGVGHAKAFGCGLLLVRPIG